MMQSVQLIVERLKNNPEDFFGDLGEMKGLGIKYPKFHEITNKLDDMLVKHDEHPDRLWFLEPDEKEALIAAYKEARRARFEAQTFHTLLTKQKPEEHSTVTMKTVGRYNSQWANAPVKCEGGPV